MRLHRLSLLVCCAAGLAILATDRANAQTVRVEVENLQPADGFYFTPLWVGFHDGSFDMFDAGSAASASGVVGYVRPAKSSNFGIGGEARQPSSLNVFCLTLLENFSRT